MSSTSRLFSLTISAPPGCVIVTFGVSNWRFRPAAKLAQAPDPQAWVKPTPLSKTFSFNSDLFIIFTKLTFVLSGKVGCSLIFFASTALELSYNSVSIIIACGLPTLTASNLACYTCGNSSTAPPKLWWQGFSGPCCVREDATEATAGVHN